MIPSNELGVIAAFMQSTYYSQYNILHIQQEYPDALVERNGIQYRAEFEFKASNFFRHGHDPRLADVIICWKNDWPDSPVPVLALANPDWHKQQLPILSAEEKELSYLGYHDVKPKFISENVNPKKRGRKPAEFPRKHYSFWLRPGLSEEQDRLIERLDQLTANGQRSRFIRRVLTTGDIEPVLDREFVKETTRVADALEGLASFWDDDESD